MQVFIIGSVLDTAKILDKRRLNKQIIECNQILNALLNGAKAWANHPCVLQYHGHEQWLQKYMQCLQSYKDNNINDCIRLSEECELIKPSFHKIDYFNQMKRRLFTKDNLYYSQWINLGISEENWYWDNINKTFIKYKNGKRIK